MNNIEKKIDDLFDEFERSDLYKRYLLVKNRLENNVKIMDLINEIKRMQKIATHNKDDLLEQEIKKLYDELNSYPLYQSYLIIKDEIEEELFRIKEPLNKYFEDILKI